MSARGPCFLLVFVIGCGGQIQTDPDAAAGGSDSGVPPGTDGGVVKKDGSVIVGDATTPPVPCGPHMGTGTVSPSGACTVSEGWSCGAHAYTVTCNCPNSTCTCEDRTGNTTVGQTVKFPNGCPSCTMNASLATLCGFPP